MRSTETPSPTNSEGAEALTVDGLAEVLVDDLTLRAGPGLSAENLGLLPAGEPAFIVDGPVAADGYEWYQLAAVRAPYHGDCADPAPPPSLACSVWFGWAAAKTPEGERWLRPLDPACPEERDTTTYISLPGAGRLACAGSNEWQLVVYLAPETGGRGCGAAVWMINPAWLWCSVLFPQPDETQFDERTIMQTFPHPSLGCPTLVEPNCPFVALKGAWVEMVGHLDDPAATTCGSVINPLTGLETPPAEVPPPDPDSVVFACRLRLVVTDVESVEAPSG